MRIINEATFRTEVKNLARKVGSERYADWVSRGVAKWLIKHNPKFVENNFVPVQARTTAVAFEGLGVSNTVFFVIDRQGKRSTLHLSEEYDKLDAKNGTLFYFLPKVTLSHWFFVQNPLLIEARDFLEWHVARNDKVDLRKFTLDALPTLIQEWQAQLAREEARRAAEALAELRRQGQAVLEAHGLIAKAVEARYGLEEIAEAWKFLRPGVDYNLLFTTDEYEAFHLLTPLALTWEATYKRNCIASYYNRLGDPNTKYLSYRPKNILDETKIPFTVELLADNGKWETVQFEAYGYRHPKRNEPIRDSEYLKHRSVVEAFFNTQKVPTQPQNLIFNLPVRQY